jgi:hypothetical protein
LLWRVWLNIAWRENEGDIEPNTPQQLPSPPCSFTAVNSGERFLPPLFSISFDFFRSPPIASHHAVAHSISFNHLPSRRRPSQGTHSPGCFHHSRPSSNFPSVEHWDTPSHSRLSLPSPLYDHPHRRTAPLPSITILDNVSRRRTTLDIVVSPRFRSRWPFHPFCRTFCPCVAAVNNGDVSPSHYAARCRPYGPRITAVNSDDLISFSAITPCGQSCRLACHIQQISRLQVIS